MLAVNPEAVYQDMMSSLQTTYGLTIHEAGLAQCRVIFDDTLGKWLRTDNTASDPENDVWVQSKFSFFRDFILYDVLKRIADIVADSPDYLRRGYADAQLMREASKSVCWHPAVRYRCKQVLQWLRDIDDEQWIPQTVICGDTDPIVLQ